MQDSQSEDLGKPANSLRNALTVWFLLFSVVPLGFITGYSILKYREGIEYELKQRLVSNIREFKGQVEGFQSRFKIRSDKFIKNRSLIYSVSSSTLEPAENLVRNWLRGFDGSKISLIREDGMFLFSLKKEKTGDVTRSRVLGRDNYQISGDTLGRLKSNQNDLFLAVKSEEAVQLIHNKRIFLSEKPVGFMEQVLVLSQDYLLSFQKRTGVELFIMNDEKEILERTFTEKIPLSMVDFGQVVSDDSTGRIYNLNLDGKPHSFAVARINWGEDHFFVGLGVSRSFSEEILRKVSAAFVTMTGTLVILLVIMIFVITRSLLRPLNQLVEATYRVQEQDDVVEVPVTSRNEIGLLTESFNQMSKKMTTARAERKEKIKELESANLELRQTQAQLVQSSKMASLGQLVAGIAHELNNPIGFISSNMVFLREHVEGLQKVIDALEKNPDKLAEIKKEVDYDYIKSDLIKLVTSCEEGAIRTREIVLGLKNFSRLDETKLKEADLHQGINDTLMLMKSEYKDRVQIHKEYGGLPNVVCNVSAINQVFMNILQNSTQAIEGNGEVWIKTSYDQGTNIAKICIRDSGSGMSDETKEKIFDPFFTTKDVGVGTGLGMSISFGIVEKHEGKITVESELGKGTEFCIELPVDGPKLSKDFTSP